MSADLNRWTGHVLTIKPNDFHTEDDPSWDWEVACTRPERCNGWEECSKDHPGMDPTDEESPAYDQYEDVEIHGILHEWQWSYGWTVPYVGCIVNSGLADLFDSVYEIARDSGPGEYRVDDDWDDGDCYLAAIEATP